MYKRPLRYPFLRMESQKWYHNYSQLVNIFEKTTLPFRISEFNSSFLVLVFNFICEINNINIFEHLGWDIQNIFEKTAMQKLCCNLSLIYIYIFIYFSYVYIYIYIYIYIFIYKSERFSFQHEMIIWEILSPLCFPINVTTNL